MVIEVEVVIGAEVENSSVAMVNSSVVIMAKEASSAVEKREEVASSSVVIGTEVEVEVECS